MDARSAKETMKQRIGLFVDISNIFYCVGKKFTGRKVNYEAYLALVRAQGEILRSLAYGAQREKEAQGFITCLKHLGFETRYKAPKIFTIGDKQIRRIDWGVGITLDVVRMLDKVDMVVLGSADPEFVPLVEFVQERGVPCVIVACGINKDLKAVAQQYIEITEEQLEPASETPEPEAPKTE